MIEIKEFRATWIHIIACFIVAIALLIILSDMMNKWTDSRIRERDVTIQNMQIGIQRTQEVLGHLRFPENVAKPLRELGWTVREQQPSSGEGDR